VGLRSYYDARYHLLGRHNLAPAFASLEEASEEQLRVPSDAELDWFRAQYAKKNHGRTWRETPRAVAKRCRSSSGAGRRCAVIRLERGVDSAGTGKPVSEVDTDPVTVP
jgi:hypothetical protein